MTKHDDENKDGYGRSRGGDARGSNAGLFGHGTAGVGADGHDIFDIRIRI